jgi:hypothetical protein
MMDYIDLFSNKYPHCVYGYNEYPIDTETKIINWYPLDTEEKFIYNLNHNYEKLLENNWIDKKINYCINKYGFRSTMFNKSSDALFFGCSNSFGIGLPEDYIWTTMIKNELNISGYNLSVPGGSMDSIFRLSNYWIEKLKPKFIFILEPDPSRKEYILKNELFHLVPKPPKNEKDTASKNLREIYESQIVSDSEVKINYIKNRLSIESLCKYRHIKLISLSSFEHFYTFNGKMLARDLLHLGRDYHVNITQKFIEKFNEQ